MVKKNRIVMPVLAAAVLAVVTSGMASASTYSYTDNERSTLLTVNSVVWGNTPTLSLTVRPGDTIVIPNQLQNNRVYDVSGQVVYSAGNVLYSPSDSGTVSARSTWIHSYSSAVKSGASGSYTINLYHQYSGSTYKSTNTTGLTFTAV